MGVRARPLFGVAHGRDGPAEAEVSRFPLCSWSSICRTEAYIQLSSFDSEKAHGFARQIDRTRHHHNRMRSREARARSRAAPTRRPFQSRPRCGGRPAGFLPARPPADSPAGWQSPARPEGKDLRHLRDCLVAHRPKTKISGRSVIPLRKGGAQGPRSRRIVRHIEAQSQAIRRWRE